MDKIFYDKIINLINKIDLKKINFKLIKTNSKKLLDVYNKLNKLWKEINEDKIQYRIYSELTTEYMEHIQILNENFLSSNSNISNIIQEKKYIHSFSFENIYFYWLSDIGKKNFSNPDYLSSNNMFKITLCLNFYKYKGCDKIQRKIIWIPINKKRDFKYNKISRTNLKKTTDNFEAFVASGVTFGLEPRITVITRYEEVEKLLIHELIHNYNMDGSEYHNQFTNILNEYKIVKNNTNEKNKNYHYEFSIYESYTELLSTYFYLLFENIKTNEELNLNKLMGQIIIELIYSYNTISNLININGYTNYNDFRDKLFFLGEICKYEYYYIKALMYNNWKLEFGNNLKDFECIYMNIIQMIKKNKTTDDKLMEEIYNNCITHTNYKYQIH
jgi:hypothetical protein